MNKQMKVEVNTVTYICIEFKGFYLFTDADWSHDMYCKCVIEDGAAVNHDKTPSK